jgi:uncharacterized phage protein (TIGR01671 family)
MREYLFRGKRTDNGEWVEGYLVYNKARKQYYIMDDVDSFPIPVHKESVGQWTGIYDINQRKIFENDIVRTQPYLYRPYSKNRQSKQFIGVVEYYTCHFKNGLNDQIYDAGWKVKVKDYGKYTHGAWSDFYKCEVIGTAFDNADLLEG